MFHRVIGIDLGTTYSAIASWHEDAEEAKIILDTEETDETKASTTPSVITLDKVLQKAIVGREAKRNFPHDPVNTIIEIKREMGKEFDPEALEKYKAQGVFNIGDPIKVQFCGEWYRPQEISAFTLMRMKELAEREMDSDVIDAVVTVPAYFTEKQKKATQEAAILAGLYPRQLIPEPTAAAICYGVDTQDDERSTYLVYDLGGGTFDVSIIQVQQQDIDGIATSGDPRLGGTDFDDAITEWALDQLSKPPYSLDLKNNPEAKANIKSKAEDVKILLSTFPEAILDLKELNPQNPPALKLTQETLEVLIDPLLRKSLNFVDKAINLAQETKGIGREEINAILLVGGSSKMPRVKTLLLDYFQKDEDFIRADLDPDTVVARGAAILGKRYAPTSPPFNPMSDPDNTLIQTDDDEGRIVLITEHALGVGVRGKRGPEFSKILEPGTNLPAIRTRGGYSNSGPTEDIEVHVYQGEREAKYTHDCTEIGVVHLGPMEAKPEGYHTFEVTFSLDQSGLLTAIVKHLNENRKYEARFDQKTGVGGKEKLAVMHTKLKSIYGGALFQKETTPPPPPPSFSVPNEEATASTEAVENQAGKGDAQQTATLVLPRVEIPEQFKSIRRRAQRLLENTIDPDLLNAFNAFSTGLNNGITGEELENLGDDLEDAYIDAKHSSTR